MAEGFKKWNEDQLLALVLIVNADKSRHVELLEGLENTCTLGDDRCPATFASVYNLLFNYVKSKRAQREGSKTFGRKSQQV